MLGPMTATMTLSQFRAKFGTNETRVLLLDDLEIFMASLQSNFRNSRVLVFGSFLSDKDYPGDIDVMAYVLASPTDSGFNKFLQLQPLAPASIDVFTLQLSMSFGPPQPLPTAEAMISAFNSLEAHVASATSCTSAIELVGEAEGGA